MKCDWCRTLITFPPAAIEIRGLEVLDVAPLAVSRLLLAAAQ